MDDPVAAAVLDGDAPVECVTVIVGDPVLVRDDVLVQVAEPVLLKVGVPERERDRVPEGVAVEAGLRDGVPLPVGLTADTALALAANRRSSR